MARKDWELSPVELSKRMSRWKDNTLLNKLAAYGYQHYTPTNKKKVREGSKHIPQKTRQQLERIYNRLSHTLQPPETKSVRGRWLTVEEWLNSLRLPELNIDFSVARLHTRRLRFAYVSGTKVVLCNKQLGEKPTQHEAVPQYTVYRIEVIQDNEIESWVQASQTIYFGSDPLGVEERKRAKEEVDGYEERNREMGNRPKPSTEVYAWWSQGVDEGKYIFLGIGVYVV